MARSARTPPATNVVELPKKKVVPGLWASLLRKAMQLPKRVLGGGAQVLEYRPNPFTPAVPFPGVVGKDAEGNQLKAAPPQIAMDAADAWKGAMDDAAFPVAGNWLGGYGAQYAYSAYAEGQEWLGYAVLAILSQRPEYRTITGTFALDMTREWIEFKSKSEDRDKQPKIDELVGRLEELKLKDTVHAAILNDGFQGRGQIYVDTGHEDDPNELKTSIGYGGKDTLAKFGRGREEDQAGDGMARDLAEVGERSKGKKYIKRLAAIEPMWCYPAQYNAMDPLKADWYRPNTWWVMGKEVHRSRLLTFVSNPVPDMLKPAYSFGGLSRTQMSKPYVDFYLRNRTSSSDLLNNFSMRVLATDLSVTTMDEGSELLQRVATMNVLADNQSTMVINKDSEEFSIAAAPLGGVKDLVAQSAEHMCLTGDALIETQRGLVTIRDVTTHDSVATRNGLAPLAWAGITGYVRELVVIVTDEGELRATPCHLIYLPLIDEFVAAESVRAGDLLLSLGDAPATSTASNWRGGATGGTRLARGTGGARDSILSFIRRCGGRIAAPFRTATSSTIGTRTRATTGLIIWNWLLAPSTWRFTSLVAASGLPFTSPAAWSARTARSSSTATLRWLGTAAIAASGSRVVVAMASLCWRTATMPLARPVAIAFTWPWLGSDGSTAVRSAPLRCITHVLAVRLERVPPTPVYNLSVANGHLPEFFADGILVHNCAPSRIPIVKFFGNQPSGLNADSEGVIRMWYDSVHAEQENILRAPIQTIVNHAMIELWGRVDDDIEFVFVDLWQLDAAGKAAIQKTKSDQRAVDIEAGVISPEEGRMSAARDPDSQYAGLDLHKPLPEPELEPDLLGPEVEAGGGGQEEETGSAAERGEVQHPPGIRPSKRDFAPGLTSAAAKFGGAVTGGFSAKE